MKGLEKGKKFFIMNHKAQYFRGLMGGDATWTHNEKEAKPFYDPSKVTVLKRWKPNERIEIIYD
jgi:hypothetical protein